MNTYVSHGCKKCPKNFESVSGYRQHYTKTHTEANAPAKRTYQCNIKSPKAVAHTTATRTTFTQKIAVTMRPQVSVSNFRQWTSSTQQTQYYTYNQGR